MGLFLFDLVILDLHLFGYGHAGRLDRTRGAVNLKEDTEQMKNVLLKINKTRKRSDEK